jgi:hypothetical protein
MNLLFIGDIFGEAGRTAIEKVLPALRTERKLDAVIANAENIAHGKGITVKTAEFLFNHGVDVITSGNHAFDQDEILSYFARQPRLLRPANYSAKSPGKGYISLEIYGGVILGVLNLAGRIHMEPAENPFLAADHWIEEASGKADVLLVDMHAEATSETRAMGWYLDGRVGAVIGSHTHVQTADEEILPKGTAFLSDAGMTGPYQSIIGMKIEPVLKKFVTGLKSKFEPASRDIRFCAVLVEIEESTGLARKIERIQIKL